MEIAFIANNGEKPSRERGERERESAFSPREGERKKKKRKKKSFIPLRGQKCTFTPFQCNAATRSEIWPNKQRASGVQHSCVCLINTTAAAADAGTASVMRVQEKKEEEEERKKRKVVKGVEFFLQIAFEAPESVGHSGVGRRGFGCARVFRIDYRVKDGRQTSNLGWLSPVRSGICFHFFSILLLLLLRVGPLPVAQLILYLRSKTQNSELRSRLTQTDGEVKIRCPFVFFLS